MREHATAVDPNSWSEARARLEHGQLAFEKGLAPTPEEKQEILRSRARILAREPDKDEATVTTLYVVEFLLAAERYAVESAYVRQVFPLKGLTPLPGTPPFVLGITNVRGQIVSVIDLKKLFDLPDRGLTELRKIVIVQKDELELGILADAIVGTRSVPLKEIQPPLPTFIGIRATYLRGVAAPPPGTAERLIVLDIDKILSDERIIVHEEVEEQL